MEGHRRFVYPHPENPAQTPRRFRSKTLRILRFGIKQWAPNHLFRPKSPLHVTRTTMRVSNDNARV